MLRGSQHVNDFAQGAQSNTSMSNVFNNALNPYYAMSGYTQQEKTYPYSPGQYEWVAPTQSTSSGSASDYAYGSGYSPQIQQQPQSLDYGSYFASILEQQRRLRELQTQQANAAIDTNANYAIDQLAGDKEKQARNAYISKEKSLNALPQASLAMGGGGLSESSLLGVNSGYENQIGELTEAFNSNKSNILNQANTAKAQNLASETASALDFANQMPSYLASMASMPGATDASMQSMVSALSSAMPTNSYNSLISRGFTDDELRKMGLL